VHRVSRSQVTHAPISNCSCSMCAMTVSKLMSTCGNNSCVSGGDGRCASNGAFSTDVPVDSGLSQRLARVDCGLSYTTGQATIARSSIVACYTENNNFLPNITTKLSLGLNSCQYLFKHFDATNAKRTRPNLTPAVQHAFTDDGRGEGASATQFAGQSVTSQVRQFCSNFLE